MEPLTQAMDGLAGKGRFKITCLTGEKSTSWTVSHQAGKASLVAAKERKPAPATATCEVLTSEETLRAVLAGELSPLEAFLQNRMRIRGDIDYGRVVLRHLAARPGMRTDICH